MTKYDKVKYYEKELKEKVDEIVRICNREKIPMFFTACVKNNTRGSLYQNEMVGTHVNNIELKDDKFPDLVNVMNGFTTVPDAAPIELEF